MAYMSVAVLLFMVLMFLGQHCTAESQLPKHFEESNIDYALCMRDAHKYYYYTMERMHIPLLREPLIRNIFMDQNRYYSPVYLQCKQKYPSIY